MEVNCISNYCFLKPEILVFGVRDKESHLCFKMSSAAVVNGTLMFLCYFFFFFFFFKFCVAMTIYST